MCVVIGGLPMSAPPEANQEAGYGAEYEPPGPIILVDREAQEDALYDAGSEVLVHDPADMATTTVCDVGDGASALGETAIRLAAEMPDAFLQDCPKGRPDHEVVSDNEDATHAKPSDYAQIETRDFAYTSNSERGKATVLIDTPSISRKEDRQDHNKLVDTEEFLPQSSGSLLRGRGKSYNLAISTRGKKVKKQVSFSLDTKDAK